MRKHKLILFVMSKKHFNFLLFLRSFYVYAYSHHSLCFGALSTQ